MLLLYWYANVSLKVPFRNWNLVHSSIVNTWNWNSANLLLIYFQIVNLIEETGHFHITNTTFDFDLCSLDKTTVRKLQSYLETSGASWGEKRPRPQAGDLNFQWRSPYELPIERLTAAFFFSQSNILLIPKHVAGLSKYWEIWHVLISLRKALGMLDWDFQHLHHLPTLDTCSSCLRVVSKFTWQTCMCNLP